jgi:hypothetical protein
MYLRHVYYTMHSLPSRSKASGLLACCDPAMDLAYTEDAGYQPSLARLAYLTVYDRLSKGPKSGRALHGSSRALIWCHVVTITTIVLLVIKK